MQLRISAAAIPLIFFAILIWGIHQKAEQAFAFPPFQSDSETVTLRAVVSEDAARLGGVGHKILVQIVADGGASSRIAVAQLTISWDARVAEIQEVIKGADWPQGSIFVKNIQNSNGTIKAAILGPDPVGRDFFTLVEIVFKVTGAPGESTEFVLSNMEIGDNSQPMMQIPIQAVGGVFEVPLDSIGPAPGNGVASAANSRQVDIGAANKANEKLLASNPPVEMLPENPGRRLQSGTALPSEGVQIPSQVAGPEQPSVGPIDSESGIRFRDFLPMPSLLIMGSMVAVVGFTWMIWSRGRRRAGLHI